MRRRNYGDRIDIHQQVNLSERQCDIAIAIWRKLGVFSTESSIHKNIRARFQEEVIWSKTFANYDPLSEKDCNKMKRFTTQIIRRYQTTIKHCGVDRIDYRQGGDSWCVICKPHRGFGLRTASRRIGSAATNIVTADKYVKSFELGINTFGDLIHRIEMKIPDLVERKAFYGEFMNAIEHKSNELDELLLLTQNEDLPEPSEDEKEKSKQEDAETIANGEEVKESPNIIDIRFESEPEESEEEQERKRKEAAEKYQKYLDELFKKGKDEGNLF